MIARHLTLHDCNVKVMLFQKMEHYTGDSKVNLDVLLKLGIEIDRFDSRWTDAKTSQIFSSVGFQSTTWVVDALLGTGARGVLRPPIAKAVAVANQLSVHKLSVDLPTGLDCDSGEASEPTFRADVTCTMVAEKVGFQNPNAHLFTGRVVVARIGIAVDLETLKTDQV